MSVVELNMLKIRMQAGMEAEARRGELLRVLPTGYGYDKAGKLVKDPDLRVQQAIELAFRVFRETGSIRKTFLWFRQERIELPVNRMGGGRAEVIWQLPKHSTLDWLFGNPFYAGGVLLGPAPDGTCRGGRQGPQATGKHTEAGGMQGICQGAP